MQLILFYELQDLHKEMSTIDKKLEELREIKELKRFKEEHQRLKEEYLKGEEKLKRNACQQEIRNNEIKNLDYNRKVSEGIKFSRETDTLKKLENIEKQLQTLEEKKQTAENDIITLISEADNINKEIVDVKKRLAFIKKKYLTGKENADKAIKALETQKSELAAKIESLVKQVDVESYELYKRMLNAHPDPVARVENRRCGGCKMEVSSMDYEALKNGSQELRCQSCGRLLYFVRL